MKSLYRQIGAAVLILGLFGCYTPATIPSEILRRAECACKYDGGIKSISIEASRWWPPEDHRFNFHCTDGLETGWIEYSGSWGPNFPFSPEECNH